MRDYKFTESEEKFAELIWQNEPILSGDLVKLCQEEMNFIRLLLKKASKVISYAMWGVVAFRLIITFSFENIF